jgi:hypothetical protein
MALEMSVAGISNIDIKLFIFLSFLIIVSLVGFELAVEVPLFLQDTMPKVKAIIVTNTFPFILCMLLTGQN